MKKNNEQEMEKAYKKWIGKEETVDDMQKEPVQEPTKEPNISDEATEGEEPYQDIQPVSVLIPELPFEAEEGDELDIHGIIKSVGENGYEIELQKLWNKMGE